jgi:hypothetical protein
MGHLLLDNHYVTMHVLYSTYLVVHRGFFFVALGNLLIDSASSSATFESNLKINFPQNAIRDVNQMTECTFNGCTIILPLATYALSCSILQYYSSSITYHNTIFSSSYCTYYHTEYLT